MGKILLGGAIVLVGIIGYVYFAKCPHWKTKQKPTEEKKEEVVEIAPRLIATFTEEELWGFNGEDESKPVYLALDGDVFDVSSSKNFKKGASYHAFAGRDASVALAKMSMDKKDLKSRDYSKLNEGETDSMKGWHREFRGKYPILGTLDKPQQAEAEKKEL